MRVIHVMQVMLVMPVMRVMDATVLRTLQSAARRENYARCDKNHR